MEPRFGEFGLSLYAARPVVRGEVCAVAECDSRSRSRELNTTRILPWRAANPLTIHIVNAHRACSLHATQVILEVPVGACLRFTRDAESQRTTELELPPASWVRAPSHFTDRTRNSPLQPPRFLCRPSSPSPRAHHGRFLLRHVQLPTTKSPGSCL